MSKLEKDLNRSQPELEQNSQTNSQKQLNSSRMENEGMLKNSSNKLSMTQLRKAILEGAMLADHLELTKLKLRHKQYLQNLKKT